MRIFLFILFISLVSCLEQNDITYFSANELTRLIASDSAKSWVLTNRIIDNSSDILDCEQDDILTFINPQFDQDTTILLQTGIVLCPGQIDSIIFVGKWRALDSANQQLIMLTIDGDSSINSIDFLTSELLTIRYQNEGKSILEEYVYPN